MLPVRRRVRGRLHLDSPPMQIGIVGLGYVGLPLAVAFAEAGHEVVGLDADAAKVERPRRRPTATSRTSPTRPSRRSASASPPTAAYADLASCDAVIDLRADAADRLARARPHLPARRRHRALGRSCSPASSSCSSRPPTPAPPASAWRRSSRSPGLAAGSDFHLAFSPERIDPGRTDYTVAHHPEARRRPHRRLRRARPRALRARSATTVVVLSTPEAAELSKLLENIFRSVNIALVNELAQLCDRLGIDVWEVIDAASTKPFGFMRFDPGPGMGGHCLPVDPFYLAFKAREHDFYPEFIELAGKVNQAQPAFCVERIERALNDAGKPVKGSKVLILGVSYKAGVGDIRESPALKIIRPAAGARRRGLLPRPPRRRSCPSSGLSSVDLDERTRARPTWRRSSPPTRSVDYEAVAAAAPLRDRLPRRHPRDRRREPGPPVAGL